MPPTSPCPAPTRWWWMRASGLLLCWELWLGTYSVGFFLFFLPGFVALWDFKTPHNPVYERVSYCLKSSPPSQLPPQDGSPTLTLISFFLPFIFCLTAFWRNGMPFWVPGVLHQHLEVIWWKLLTIQMIFWWICGGESGLPVLFLPPSWDLPSPAL